MQEEDDDEDDDGECEESLNRRGSKSEGRINITLQDRLAENERLKKECAAKTIIAAVAPTRSVFEGICNVKILTNQDNDPNRLGKIRMLGKKVQRPTDIRPSTADAVFRSTLEPPRMETQETIEQAISKSNETGEMSGVTNNGVRSHSVDATSNGCKVETVETHFLTDSATISLPIQTQTASALVNPPKYKTMPSPTRSNTILPGAMCLNEIFEEGTDVGSSDTSTTTTPRPVARHTTFTNNRSHSHSSSHAHRRSKFNKARTASCSSSDDDDSENRKKRAAHKIVDSAKPFQVQRRDSDSSDSQDQCNPADGTSQSNNVQLISTNSNSTEQSNDTTNQAKDSNQTNGRQKNIQGFQVRRHRTGRRRTGETRLRESQSLNRITEVQESELPLSALNSHNPNRSPATASTSTVDSNCQQSPISSTKQSPNQTAKPTKLGFGARLLQGFRKSDSNLASPNEQMKNGNGKNAELKNDKNNSSWNGNGTHHITSANSNEALDWIKHSKPPLRVKAHQRLKNLKCLVDIFS